MTQDRERAIVEGDGEDRLSDLPGNVIDLILEILPARDAARTSILSRKWRYIWAMLPYMTLDERICDNEAVEYQSCFKQTVYEILCMHLGDIVKFDLSGVYWTPHKDIDRWVLYVTRNGVRELALDTHNMNAYKLPSYVFQCPTLTHLDIRDSVFKPPNSFVGFQNLTNLHLEGVTFEPTKEFCVINAPLLVSLVLTDCDGTQYLKIVSPLLDYLVVDVSHLCLLNCFMNCQNLKVLHLGSDNLVENLKHNERTTLEKFFFSLANTLEKIYLDSIFFEILSAGTVPKGLPFTLNCLCGLSFGVDFGNWGQTCGAIQLIKSAPNLGELQICVYATGTSDSAEVVLKCLETSACLDRPLNKLKHVIIYRFKGSKIELLLMKLLFACTPYLLRMSIYPEIAFGSKEEITIKTELMCFPKASPEAELCYLQPMF